MGLAWSCLARRLGSPLAYSIEDGLDHGLGVLLAQRGVSCEQPKDHRAVDQIENNLGIEVFANLPSQYTSFPHHASRIPPGV